GLLDERRGLVYGAWQFGGSGWRARVFRPVVRGLSQRRLRRTSQRVGCASRRREEVCMNRDSSCLWTPASRWRDRVLAACLALVVVVVYVVLSPPARTHAAGGATVKQHLYPNNLPRQVANPGSLLMAFNTPVIARNGRFQHDSRGSATDQQLAAVNGALTSIGADEVDHLFTNIPAATLDAARAKAAAATHAFVTDFTQVYQVGFNPAVNSGLAANRMAASSSVVSSAMPDFVMQPPSRGEAQSISPAEVQQALAAPRAAAL